MPFLLDINVLIARTDPRHEHHSRCLAWERLHRRPPFATCPLTENGFLRIYGHPNYPGGPGSPAEARIELDAIRRLPQHAFIPDDISIAEQARIQNLKSVTPRQLTDLYLLALAVRHDYQFATLDANIDASLVVDGPAALCLVDP